MSLVIYLFQLSNVSKSQFEIAMKELHQFFKESNQQSLTSSIYSSLTDNTPHTLQFAEYYHLMGVCYLLDKKEIKGMQYYQPLLFNNSKLYSEIKIDL